MENQNENRPVLDGMWTEKSKNKRHNKLIGSQCDDCKEIYFPRKKNGICTYCQSRNLVNKYLSTQGKIYSYTIVQQKPPEFYIGEVPYAIGFVELPEGIRIRTHFTDWDVENLRTGMDVKLVFKTIGKNDSGQDVISYMFSPCEIKGE